MSHRLRPLDVYPITTRRLEVLRVADVTPGMRRVTLGGPGLDAHIAPNGYAVAEIRSQGIDDEFKLILQHPDGPELVAPTQNDGMLDWPRGDEHLLTRTYTVRRWDPASREVDVDFVRHGTGPATSWAERVQAGETVQIAGPKSSAPNPLDVDWILVAGDETALPAIARWLESWPEGVPGQVFIEVAERSHRQQVAQPEGVEITWLSRDGAPAGHSTLLADALRGAEWLDGTPYAWVAGEALTLAPIRRWLRRDKELTEDHVEVTGYWRRQELEAGDDAAVETVGDDERFHELIELAPGFALRVAATIGLGAAFDGSAQTIDELARRTGANPEGLRRLLGYLEPLGVVAMEGEAVRLTDLGGSLDDDGLAERLSLEGYDAQRELAGLLALLESVRTGVGESERCGADSWAARVDADPELLRQRREAEADEARWVADALAAAIPARGELVVSGRGADTYAAAIAKVAPSASVRVVERVADLDEPVDGIVLASALDDLGDTSAAHLLRVARASIRPGGRLYVYTEGVAASLVGEHEAEDALVDFALSGGGTRTLEHHGELFERAELPAPERVTVGWGDSLFVFDVS
jgi:NADPH-dependent ferric siderophore reductase